MSEFSEPGRFQKPGEKKLLRGHISFCGGVFKFKPYGSRQSMLATVFQSKRKLKKENESVYLNLSDLRSVSSTHDSYTTFKIDDDAYDYGTVIEAGFKELQFVLGRSTYIVKCHNAISANLWSSLTSFKTTSSSFEKQKRFSLKSPSKRLFKKLPEILACVALNLIRKIKEEHGYCMEGIFRVAGSSSAEDKFFLDLLYQAATPAYKVKDKKTIEWYSEYASTKIAKTLPNVPSDCKFIPEEIKKGWLKYEKLWTTSAHVEAVVQNYLKKRLEISSSYSCHTCASVIKRILRMMPDTLFTSHLYPRFQEATQTEDLATLVDLLPKSNRKVLKALFELLNMVVKKHESSKMTVENLCIVIAPGLLKEREPPVGYLDVDEERKLGNKIQGACQSLSRTFGILLQYHHEIFLDNQELQEAGMAANSVRMASPSPRRTTLAIGTPSSSRKAMGLATPGRTMPTAPMGMSGTPRTPTRNGGNVAPMRMIGMSSQRASRASIMRGAGNSPRSKAGLSQAGFSIRVPESKYQQHRMPIGLPLSHAGPNGLGTGSPGLNHADDHGGGGSSDLKHRSTSIPAKTEAAGISGFDASDQHSPMLTGDQNYIGRMDVHRPPPLDTMQSPMGLSHMGSRIMTADPSPQPLNAEENRHSIFGRGFGVYSGTMSLMQDAKYGNGETEDGQSDEPPEGLEAREAMNKELKELIDDLTVLQGKTLQRKALKVSGVRELKGRLERLKIMLLSFTKYEKKHRNYKYVNVALWIEEHKAKFDREHDMWRKLEKAGFSFFKSLNTRYKDPVQKAIRNVMEALSTFTAAFSLDKQDNIFRRRGKTEMSDAEENYKKAQDYFFGHTRQRDWFKAREFYLKAISARHLESLFCFANMLRLGQGGNVDINQAKWYYQCAADLGHKDSQYWLGRIYEEEYSVYKRSDAASIALEYYYLAAQYDPEDPKDVACPLAMVALGFMYQHGQRYGISENLLEAANLYFQAAQLKCAPGMCHLGLLHFHGHLDHEGQIRAQGDTFADSCEGKILRYKAALSCFTEGAKLGHSDSHLNIGRMYEGGYGVEASEEKAMYHYECAMTQGNNPDAEASLGYLLVKMNLYAKAVNHLSRAADRGSAEAFYHLGELYEHGLGIGKSLSIAHKHYAKACEMGYPKAVIKRAHFLFSGHAEPGQIVRRRTRKERYREALRLYKKAAEEYGMSEADNCLGVMHEEGFGVDLDYKLALEYYSKGVAKNNSEAMVNLAMMLETGKGVENPDFSRAYELLEKAAGWGNVQAKVLLARKDIMDEYDLPAASMYI